MLMYVLYMRYISIRVPSARVPSAPRVHGTSIYVIMCAHVPMRTYHTRIRVYHALVPRV